MQPIAFCNRCRGMKVGWNARYMLHCLMCQEWASSSYKLLILTAVICSFVFAFPVSTGIGLAVQAEAGPRVAEPPAITDGPVPVAESTSNVVSDFLARHKIDESRRGRIARAILSSSQKYDVDPLLVASIVMVESRANPFAVSEADSIGLMQIHARTWGHLVDQENINLLRVEDNVELGVRILKGYINLAGLREGIARYRGRLETPESYQSADEYVQKVEAFYGRSFQ